MRRKSDWSSKLLSKLSNLKKPIKSTGGKETPPELKQIQKNIYRQAGLAGLTIVLTIVILFAMTSAWYTNIVQTSGLVFEAEPWGFDGTIIVGDEEILAAPGDEGVVSLQVQNTSESLSTISVNVSKANMSANIAQQEMQKRLYLYVDTHMTRSGETMDRVYINNFEGYNYTVFGKGQLTLTEQISNAPRIKWEWVYDVLGYYVMANPVKGPDGKITTMSIQDYLRPIQYNYDEAYIAHSTDENGNQIANITTIEGMNWKSFLVSVSEKDGYPGKINTDNAVYDAIGRAYYPVEVDAAGNGVYAYLCSYSDIEMATQFDTDLGELAYRKAIEDPTLTQEDKEMLYHPVTISISAQNSDSTVVGVSNSAALNQAIEEGLADVIQLSADITLTEANPLIIPENTRTTIDLNGHVITGTNLNGAAIYARQGSSLTLLGGTMEGPAANTGKTRGVEMTGAEVIMSDITMKNFDYGIYMADHLVVNNKANALDSRVHMVGSEVDAKWYGVYINGNGTNSDQKSQLIIEDSTVSGDGYGITGSGNAVRSGTDIQIRNSTIRQNKVTGTGAGIFHPQINSTLTITQNSLIEGYTGIALKGGHASITDSTVTGFGVKHMNPEEYASGSGFADTADAVYIEANYDYDISLTITNSVLTLTADSSPEEARSLRVYKENAPNVTVQIISGTFNQEQPANYLAEGSTQKLDNKKYVVTAAK